MKPRIKKDANYVQGIVDHIKKNLEKGYTVDSLRWALVSQGHSRMEVEKALQVAQSEMAKAAPAPRPAPVQEMPQVEVPVEPEKKSFWKKVFG